MGKGGKDGKRRELKIDRCFSWSAKKSWRGGRREEDATEERDKRNLNERERAGVKWSQGGGELGGEERRMGGFVSVCERRSIPSALNYHSSTECVCVQLL